MDLIWYYAAVLLAKTLRSLPLRLVARLGRIGGGAAYWIDGRHRRVAALNLSRCFHDKSPRDRRALLLEHFKRLGENYASAVKTSGMSAREIEGCLTVVGAAKLASPGTRGAILAVGHFGNFELNARAQSGFGPLRLATTYRALKQPRLEKLVRRLRDESGCRFFDRRREGRAMREALARGGIALGLLSDQHAGSGGLRVAFLGHECSVTAAPVVLAQRYRLPLYTAVCFRVSLGQWRLEIGDEIATRCEAGRRTPEAVMADVNRAFEQAIRRDPANWFWVHDRWRFYKGTRKRSGAALAAESVA